MDCKTAEQLAAFLAPGKVELDAEHSAALEAHVRACPECARRIRFAQSFDQGVARAMRSVAVPAGLKERITARLAPARPAWHRRRSVRVWAAAAAVLIAVGIALTWNGNDKLPVNAYQIASAEPRTPQAQADAAREWLGRQGVDFRPKEPLNLTLASGWGLTAFPGTKKLVPMLVLVSPRPVAVARVYVIRSDDFDLSMIQEFSESMGAPNDNGSRVAIVLDRERPTKVAYVIVYTGDSLEPFNRAEPISA